MYSVTEENIMEHSLQVAEIAHAIALIKNRMFGGNVDEYKVLCLAVYHEASEVITGDLPTPIKYFNSQINTAYKDLEDLASEKLICSFDTNAGIQFYAEYRRKRKADGHKATHHRRRSGR